MSFIAMPLAAFLKTFGLTELKNGYIRIPGMPDLKFGNKLGEWESEMTEGDYMVEFVSSNR